MSNLINCLCVLLMVAFFTLMERKVMGVMHFRKGPNKLIIMGLTQPMSDAVKLLTKESLKLSFNMNMMMYMGPCLSMILMILCWLNYPPLYNTNSNNMKIFLILAIMSLSVFPLILCSWGPGSKYSLLGGNRGVSQTISYEVCLIMFLLMPFYLLKSYNLLMLNLLTQNLWVSLWTPVLFMYWMTICLAETNRTPFDLSEGESEIVSGFNIEYSGLLFTFIFISEYGMIAFLSYFTCLMFLGNSLMMLKVLCMCFIFIWARCCFPRMRYDYLMMMCWKVLLPLVICLLIFTYPMI